MNFVSLVIEKKWIKLQVLFIKWCKLRMKQKAKIGCGKSLDTDNTLVIMKNECLWEVDIEFKILMRKVKSSLKQTTPLQICSAPFLNSPEENDYDPLSISFMIKIIACHFASSHVVGYSFCPPEEIELHEQFISSRESFSSKIALHHHIFNKRMKCCR